MASNKYVKVKISGNLFKADKLPLAIDAILTDVGEEAASFMRSITSESDVSKRLTHSITWQTQTKGSNAKGVYRDEDKIDKPTEAGVLYVGSNAPHAASRNTHAGIHRDDEGSEEFIESLSKWANVVLGISKDSPDMYDRARFWYLVDAMRNEVQYGIPFLDPTANAIPAFVKSAVRRCLKLAKGPIGK